MTLDAFLTEGDKHEQAQDSRGGFPTIAKVQIRWAYRSGIGPTSMYFPYSYGDDEGGATAEAQCKAKIGGEKWTSGRNKGKLKEPVHGLFTEVYGDDVPTSKGGSWQTDIWSNFIPVYENDKIFANKTLSDEIKNSVTGPMPYTAIVNSLMEINAPVKLFSEPVWCKLFQEVDQWEQLKVIQGERQPRTHEEKEVPYRFWLVKQVYANEAEAKAEAEIINAGQVASQQPINIKLSVLAIEKWGQQGTLSAEETLKEMKTQRISIENFIQNLQNGIGTEGSEKLSMPNAQSVAANGHGMEASDLPLIGIEEVPF